MAVRIEVATEPDAREFIRPKQFSSFPVDKVQIVNVYTVDTCERPFSRYELDRIAKRLIDPITESRVVPERFDFAVEIGYKPGVADNEGKTVTDGIEDSLKMRFEHQVAAFSELYLLSGKISRDDTCKVKDLPTDGPGLQIFRNEVEYFR